jgi:hypothetical protein
MAAAFIGHGFHDGEGWEELSLLPREPAKATHRQRKSPQNRSPSAAPRRAEPLCYDGKWRTRGARRRGQFCLSRTRSREGERGPNTKMGFWERSRAHEPPLQTRSRWRMGPREGGSTQERMKDWV